MPSLSVASTQHSVASTPHSRITMWCGICATNLLLTRYTLFGVLTLSGHLRYDHQADRQPWAGRGWGWGVQGQGICLYCYGRTREQFFFISHQTFLVTSHCVVYLRRYSVWRDAHAATERKLKVWWVSPYRTSKATGASVTPLRFALRLGTQSRRMFGIAASRQDEPARLSLGM